MNTEVDVNLLSNYLKSDYLVGNSTPQALAEARERLGHDLAPMPAELSAVDGLIHEMADTSKGPTININLQEYTKAGEKPAIQTRFSWIQGPDWI